MTTELDSLMALAQEMADRIIAFKRFPDRDRREAMRKAEENFTDALRALIEERDHFAGLAMQGLLTNSIAALTNINQVATIKTLAYALADAMLREGES